MAVLLTLAPEQSTLRTDAGTETLVDTGVLLPGERIGADGTVGLGSSEVDQASITGEPLPVPCEPGDEIFAGTLNLFGVLHVQFSRPASESVVAQIVQLVEQASATKGTTQLFIEKVEQRYSLTVVLTTLLPLLSAIANASRHGVLVKNAVVTENLGRTTLVVFDKTGTLTFGAPHLTAVHPLDDLTAAEVLRLAASVEDASEHPLGRAIVTAALALLTGDNHRAAMTLAEQDGITDVRAGLLPHEKAAVVQEFRDAGHRVLVVEDGINDGLAMATADVGIAMAGIGSDLALQTADAVLIGLNGLRLRLLRRAAAPCRVHRNVEPVNLRPLLIALLAAAPLITGCAGRSCDDLPALRAERDQARAGYGQLTAPGTAPPEITEQADADVHVLDRQVYDTEQACRDR